MVTLAVAFPRAGPDDEEVRALYPAPAVNDSVFFVSTPMAPINSSLGCAVRAVAPDAGVVLLPVAPAVWSSAAARTPENSLTLSAFDVARGWVTVIVLFVPRAVATVAEQTTVRTPDVPEPLVTSASTVYEFPLLSAHETAPADGSITKVTMRVWPTATLTPPASVTEIDVPATVFPSTPTFRTNAIAAWASDLAGPASNTRARSARVMSRELGRSVSPVMLPPPPTLHPCSRCWRPASRRRSHASPCSRRR